MTYLIKCSPSVVIGLKTPQNVWYGKPFDYTDLKIFGCPAYALLNEGKLDLKAKKCIFLGYASGVKGYRLWCIENSKSFEFLISRDVKFDDSAMFEQIWRSIKNAGTSASANFRKKVELTYDTTDSKYSEKPDNI